MSAYPTAALDFTLTDRLRQTMENTPAWRRLIGHLEERLRWRSPVAIVGDLPTADTLAGDVRTVLDGGTGSPKLYGYDGATWVDLTGGGGGGGGEDLAATLVLGNVTGAAGTSGLPIKGPAATAETNDDGGALVIQGGDPSGTGYRGPIQASDYGNTRAPGAVDLQVRHYGPTDVAAANYSTIVGGGGSRITLGDVNIPTGDRGNGYSGIIAGYGNVIEGDTATYGGIIGGLFNRIDPGTTFGAYCGMIGGSNNYIGPSSYGSVIAGGYNAEISDGGYYASNSMIAAGIGNTIRGRAGYGGAYSAFASGRYNTVEGENSVAFGRFNTVSAGVAFVGGNSSNVEGYGSFAWGNNLDSHPRADYAQAWGQSAYSYVAGQTSWAAATSGSWGDGEGQGSRYCLLASTSTAAATEMTTNATTPGTNDRLFVKPGRTYMARILVSARQIGGTAGTVGDSATWEIQAAIKRDLAGNTTLVGAPTGTGAPLFNDAGGAAWTIGVTADDVNETLVLTATGEVDKTIRWCAHIFAAEVGSDT